MPVADDLRQFWLSDRTIRVETGGRVCQLVADFEDELPYVIFARNSAEAIMCLDGDRGPTTARYDVSVRGRDQDEAERLTKRLTELSDGFRGTIGEGTVVQGMFVANEDDESLAFPDGDNELETHSNFAIEITYE